MNPNSNRATPDLATQSSWRTVTEAARQLGITERSVWRLVAKGRLPKTTDGGRTLVDTDAKCQCFCQSDPVYKRGVARILRQLADQIEGESR